MMSRILIPFAVFVVILCGCSAQHPMRYSEEDIVKIELVITDNASEAHPEDSAIVCTLEGKDIAGFMAKLDELMCYKNTSPHGYYGTYEIRFHYSNGDVDMIGSTANGYIAQGEEVCQGWFSYHTEDMQKLFEEYIAVSIPK